MITGELKNKIDKIWTDLWAGGITNPLTVIEQLTYLLFIRSLDQTELAAERNDAEGWGDPNRKPIFTDETQVCRWHKFMAMGPQEKHDLMKERVFPFIKSLNSENGETAFSRFMGDASYLIPSPVVLDKILLGIDQLYEDVKVASSLDLQGDIYEYMLGKLSTAGQIGQFRTPKHIRDMMAGLVELKPGERLCDPACGTAGFLVSAAERLRKRYDEKKAAMLAKDWEAFAGPMFAGFDVDRTMARIAAMNLALHGITTPTLEIQDSVSKENDVESAFDVILANPPFTGTIDAERIADDLKAVVNTKKTELLFVALFLRLLKKGGRCACVVPDGVLFGASKAHKALRKELVENHFLQAVISLPSGVFKPYAGVSTAILVFAKTGAGGTEDVWFYDVKADGFTLDDKRSPTDANDLPDLLNRWERWTSSLDGRAEEASRKRSEQSFFVPKADIVANDYDLSINRYKEVVYETVEYDSPAEILARLEQIDKEIAEQMAALKKALKD